MVSTDMRDVPALVTNGREQEADGNLPDDRDVRPEIGIGFFACVGLEACSITFDGRMTAVGAKRTFADCQCRVSASNGYKYCSRTKFSSNGFGIGLATDPR